MGLGRLLSDFAFRQSENQIASCLPPSKNNFINAGNNVVHREQEGVLIFTKSLFYDIIYS